MQIIPSILERDAGEFIKQIQRLTPYFNHFQIDIADGIFVPNKTIQIEELVAIFTDNRKLTTNNCFDFHLMVKDWQKEIKKIRQLAELAKINNILVHFSVLTDNRYLTTDSSTNIGLVINPSETVNDIKSKFNLNDFPIIQLMSVVPGFQGASFIPQTLNKIEQLRHENYRHKIYLDGGINQVTIPLIMKPQNKPDALCIGSFITKADNLAARIEYLRNIHLH